jgi:RNA polymerase sigma factor (sigma-70 family)
MDDAKCLEEFIRSRSEPAFAQLVARHINLVHAAATRQSRDPHLADDIAQAVFIVLARRAASVNPAHLTGWLLATTRYAVKDALKRKSRRDHHEQQAAAMKSPVQSDAADQTPDVARLIDEAIAHLNPADRTAVALRFLERKPLADVAQALNISEDAAQKRVSRAIVKLRARLAAKGVTCTLAALAALLTDFSVHTVPPALGQSVATTALAAAGGATVSATAAAIADGTIRLMSFSFKPIAVAVAVLLITSAAVMYFAFPSHPRQTSAVPLPAPAETRSAAAPAPILARDDSLAEYPIAPGWPLALPGSVTGTPVVADLEGNGKLAVIVPCEALHEQDAKLVHPQPYPAVLLYAFHSDGTPLPAPGWPVQLVSPAQREHMERAGRRTESWTSSPSVCTDRAGRTRIVITTPYFLGFRVISPEGKCREYYGGSQWANVPLIDIDRDGTPDIVTGAGIMNIDGGPVKSFTRQHPILRLSGYSPCIGDADGDGQPEIYHLFADTVQNLESGGGGYRNPRTDIMAFDHLGRPLAGWPREIGKEQLEAHPPVMGDIAGDSKLEIVATDRTSVYAWTCDGNPVIPGSDGTFKSGLSPVNASPTLADLDGDGKAEIIIFDSESRTIRAWHGDGRPAAGPDGVIAMLPMDCPGISVADLGGDGIMDLFAGTFWVKFDPRTRTSTISSMLPAPAEVNTTQPTICDLDNDGQADVIFGTNDGRLFVYQTHLAYKPQWMQWPTANGNFQHTGAWTAQARR